MLLQTQAFNSGSGVTLPIAIITATALFLLLSGFIVTILIMYQRRRQEHTLEITEMRNKYEQELLRSQLEIQEQTLRTISQEIHDNIGQSLTLAKLQLHCLQDDCSSIDIQPTRDLLSKSINDLRDLSKSLNPDRIADIGLVESIRHELQLLQKTNTIETSVSVSGTYQKNSPEIAIIIFRIFQEIMNNVIRHANASRMTVNLNYLGNELLLAVQDNGTGFKHDYKKGIGMNSMQNRASLINGSFNWESTNNGTKVWIKVPMAHG